MTKKYLTLLTYEIVGAAIEVHKILGPGLLESVYHKCLAHEFTLRMAGASYQDIAAADGGILSTVKSRSRMRSLNHVHPVSFCAKAPCIGQA